MEEAKEDKDPASMTRDELLALVTQLEDVIDAQEDEIAQLTRSEMAGRGRPLGRQGGSLDEDDLMRENDDLRDKLSREQADAARNLDELVLIKAQMEILVAEKLQAEGELVEARRRTAVLEVEVRDAVGSSRTMLLKSQDVSKQKSENQKQQLQLLQENEALQNDNKELIARLEKVEEEKALFHEIVDKYEVTKKELEVQRDDAEIVRENIEDQLRDVQEALEESERNLAEVEASEVRVRLQLEELQIQSRSDREHDAAALKKAVSELSDGRKQIAVLKDTTAMGTKQAEVDTLIAERDELVRELSALQGDAESAALERDQLAERLIEFEHGIGAEVEGRVVAEKESGLLLERRLRSAVENLAQANERQRIMESEKQLLAGEVDELNHWRAVYESGHGLQELARSQKKIKEDNRRLGIALEQMTRKLGEAIDANGLLDHAFNKLRQEAGKSADFKYDTRELREEVLGDNARLRAQVLELEEQVESLEAETIRVRRALKNQAGVLGAAGFKYAGMDAEMLVRVNEFAAALREGRDLIPTADRPSELLRENRRLKEEARVFQTKLELFEREFGGSGGQREDNLIQDSQIKALRDDVRRLLHENGELKNRLGLMQDELVLLINRQLARSEGGAQEGSGGELSAALVASNEMVLLHLRELQQHMHQGEQDDEEQPASERLSEQPHRSLERTPSGRPPQGRGSRSLFPHTPSNLSGSRFPQSAAFSGAASFSQTGVPVTPHGKTLLSKTLANLNLPDESWAGEVRDLNAQLVECVEQLFEREDELNETRVVVGGLERTLVGVKQQLATLYYDHSKRAEEWRVREKQVRADLSTVLNERDDLRLRLRRTEETLTLLQREDAEAVEIKVRELTRRVTVHEVNEAILSRRFIAQAEQLECELQRRLDMQRDLAEVEGALKKRVLYLEQCKASLGNRVERLEARLARAAPIDDLKEAQTELEGLREEHLEALRREMDAKVTLLRMNEQSMQLHEAQAGLEAANRELATSRAHGIHLQHQLDEQKHLTSKSLLSANASSELSSIVADCARYRIEVGRLEVELSSERRSLEGARDALKLHAVRERELVRDLEQSTLRAEQLSSQEGEMRAASIAIHLKYDAGLTRDEAEGLRSELGQVRSEQAKTALENCRLRELAEIATQQAEAVVRFRHQGADEMQELLASCSLAQSLGDDELIIGRLQRQLMSTKASYKSFASKYHSLRGDMGQRELVIRALEHRLDQREAASFVLKTAHQSEVAVIKRALRDLESFDPQAGAEHRGVSRLGKKISGLSHKMNSVSDLVNTAVSNTLELEEKSRGLAGTVLDLENDREALLQRCSDLELAARGDDRKHQIATRLVAISEEVRAASLQVLQQKREISVLAQEKRHLQSLLSSVEANVRDLEESKVRGDSRRLLPPIERSGGRELADIEELLFSDLLLDGDSHALVTTAAPRINSSNSGLRAEELLLKLQSAGEKLSQSKRDVDNVRADAKSQVEVMQNGLNDQAELIRYYEGVLEKEGLPVIRDGEVSMAYKASSGRDATLILFRVEQEQIQQTATATIGSLKQLIEEKNKTIERLRVKLSTHDVGRPRSAADRLAEKALAHTEDWPPRERVREGRVQEDSAGLHQKHLDQLDAADAVMSEKDRTITHLETRLAAESNACERAKIRCGSALDEMEAMKKDMVTLVRQLQESEGRHGGAPRARTRPALDTSVLLERADESKEGDRLVFDKDRSVVERRATELKKALRVKEEKIRGYREIIVRLKDEFIKAEEERAVQMLRQQQPDRDRELLMTGVNREELTDLRRQFSALKEDLRDAKGLLERAKKEKERVTLQRMAAQEETEKLDAQLVRSEANAASAQETVSRVRKDLERSRENEARLRLKLKEMADGGAAAGDRALQERFVALERELEVTRAQNAALRRTESEDDHKGEAQQPRPALKLRPKGHQPEQPVAESKMPDQARPSVSNVAPRLVQSGRALGGAMEDKDSGDARGLAAARWEAEKKFSGRMATLEKRLNEKMEECEELNKQLARARSAGATLQSQRAVKSEASSRTAPTDLVLELEMARRRVFELENEAGLLRRRVEVDLANDAAELRHELAQTRLELMELRAEGAERPRGVTGEGRSIRDSEDRFMREDRLREEAGLLRRERAELEVALLEKDARALEMRFDLESKQQEAERLRRRCRELEGSFKTLSDRFISRPSGDDRPAESRPSGATAGGRRELELEGVVDSMKRVAEKLRADNERLRKGGSPDDQRLADAEKRSQTERRRADSLDAELKVLTAKVKTLDEGSQKLVRHQQQAAQLRKQLAVKDGELSAALESRREIEADAKKRMGLMEERLHAAEAAALETGARHSEAADLRRRAAEQERLVKELQEALFAARQEALRQKFPDSSRERPQEIEPLRASSGDLIRGLREENARLREELGAFDEDFFEEIENLKFAHAEAVRKLRILEQQAGSRRQAYQ